jgi:hypothetical protein
MIAICVRRASAWRPYWHESATESILDLIHTQANYAARRSQIPYEETSMFLIFLALALARRGAICA